MLQLVLGRSGTGKTEYVYRLVADAVKNGEDKLLFIIPDQSSFYTEKVFLELLGPKQCQTVQAVGFSRLCDLVYSQIGNVAGIPIDEGGRSIIMNMAIEQVQDQLCLYEKHVKNNELVELMLHAEKEFKKSAISTDILRKKAQLAGKGPLQDKLNETALVCDTFQAILSQAYIDPLDRLTQLYHTLQTEKIFAGYTVVVDGFSGFTMQEHQVLEALMAQCAAFYCVLTNDPYCNDDLFYTTARTTAKLKASAKKLDIPVKPPVVLTRPERFRNEELSALEQNFYRLDNNKYNHTIHNITVFEGSSIYGEADYTAAQIKQLVAEQGYAWNDIAILCRSTDEYAGILDTALEKYTIPYFMDKPQNIQSKPVIKLVLSCMEAVNTNFDRESVLSVLKTGLTNISLDAVAEFENYLLVWNITGRKFLDDFTAHPKGFADSFTQSDEKQLKSINTIRKAVIEPLYTFKQKTREATGTEITKALYSLVTKLHVGDNLLELSRHLEDNNQIMQAQEQLRLWDIFIAVLDKMAVILGDYKVTPKRYQELLSMQFVNEDISTIPAGMDQVTVGTADRARLVNKKVVFVLGAVEGQFPHKPVPAGIFTNQERQQLIQLELPMNDTLEQLVFQEKFLAYSAVSAASEQVYISWYSSDLKGESKLPSSIVREVHKLFPLLNAKVETGITLDTIWSEKTAFEYLANHFTDNTGEVESLYQYFSSIDVYKPKLYALQRAAEQQPLVIKDSTVSEALFGNELSISASQIEKYYLCGFQYFCQYGLKLKERRPAEIDSMEYGSLVHYVLEEFFRAKTKQQLSQITDREIIKDIEEIFEQYANTHLGGLEDKTDSFQYLFHRMKQYLLKLIRHMADDFAGIEFFSVDFELNIGEEIPAYTLVLPNGRQVKICGYVDRVDLMEKEGKTYIRVVDYKTGTKEFKLSEVMYGLNLQMLIYLSAIGQNGKDKYGEHIIPAGVLYMPASAAAVNAESGQTAEEIRKKAEQEYKMNGLILNTPEVVTGMENGAVTYYKRGGEIKVGKKLLAGLEEMGAIFSKIDDLVISMGENLYKGNVSPVPAKGLQDGCQFCPYTSVCGYTDAMPCHDISALSRREIEQELGLSAEETAKEGE